MSNPEKSFFATHQEPQEACGITGIYSKTGDLITSDIPLMQYELHHRGRDSSGMAVYHDNGRITLYKDAGSTGDVFAITKHPDSKIKQIDFDFRTHDLLAKRGIGQNRYGTSGDEHKDSDTGAQPMYVEWEGRTVAIAFNGNIPQSEREKLHSRLPGEMNPGVFDTDDIVRAIASAEGDTWKERIVTGMRDIQGAYALTILPDDGKVYGLRGPSGTWPLWLGESDDRYVLASESVTDQSLTWREVRAGELVTLSDKGVEIDTVYQSQEARCVLHDVYGAHPDSFMQERETYRDFREKIGEELAKEFPLDADLYAGVPNSGLDIAAGYTRAMGVPLTNIFRVLSSAERSYISKNLAAAQAIIKNKFIIDEEVIEKDLLRGKKVVLAEDSIIKGSTSEVITEQLLQAGASQVDWVVGTSQFDNDCELGYVVRKPLLIGLRQEQGNSYSKRTATEIATLINANSVNFLSHEGTKNVYGPEHNPCLACMGGQHPFSRRDNLRLTQVFAAAERDIDNSGQVVKMITAAD